MGTVCRPKGPNNDWRGAVLDGFELWWPKSKRCWTLAPYAHQYRPNGPRTDHPKPFPIRPRCSAYSTRYLHRRGAGVKKRVKSSSTASRRGLVALVTGIRINRPHKFCLLRLRILGFAVLDYFSTSSGDASNLFSSFNFIFFKFIFSSSISSFSPWILTYAKPQSIPIQSLTQNPNCIRIIYARHLV